MAPDKSFDVFLSYSRADKEAVEVLAHRLQSAGVRPFLDRWHLVAGTPWQEELEQAMQHSHACVVFLGPSGISIWQNEEMRVALQLHAAQPDFRVVPVLLPYATQPEGNSLPLFLSRFMWVDFRGSQGLNNMDAFHRLVLAIRGKVSGSHQERPSHPQHSVPKRYLELTEGFVVGSTSG